jgi:hypothetical protein
MHGQQNIKFTNYLLSPSAYPEGLRLPSTGNPSLGFDFRRGQTCFSLPHNPVGPHSVQSYKHPVLLPCHKEAGAWI